MSDNHNERSEAVPLNRTEILQAMSETLTEIDNQCGDMDYSYSDATLALFVVQTSFRLALLRQYCVMLLDANGMKMVEQERTTGEIPF